MGGGTRSVTAVSDPKVVPELRPFVKRVGQLSEEAINLPELSLARFAREQPVPIPGLSPVQEALGARSVELLTRPPPVPVPEQIALGVAGALPIVAGQPVSMSPQIPAALRTAEQTAVGAQGLSGILGPAEAGLRQLQRLTAEGGGVSPAVQQALTGLQTEIVPAVQNQAAREGLAQSGFLPNEIARVYARELVPIFLQGLQQEQQAGQALVQSGFQAVSMQQRALEQLRDTQVQAGQIEQALETDARIRELQAAQTSVPQLVQLGQAETGREAGQVEEARKFGELQRQVELQRAQATLDAFSRQRELATGLINPFGSFAVFGGGGSQSVSPRGGLGGLLKG